MDRHLENQEVADVEAKIRKLLLDLERMTERRVAKVSVDFRVPANLMVTIKMADSRF
jgi:hypothetical protein